MSAGKLVKQIRDNAVEIERLHARIHECFRHRDCSSKDRTAWSEACAEFHRRYPDIFYPGGASRWQAFLSRDTSETETVIAILDEDPRYFRSGYLKQIIWHRLKRYDLSTPQASRLEGIAFGYLQKPMRQEFWDMSRYVRWRGSEDFWQQIAVRAEFSPESMLINKAGLLLLLRQNLTIRWRRADERTERLEMLWPDRSRIEKALEKASK